MPDLLRLILASLCVLFAAGCGGGGGGGAAKLLYRTDWSARASGLGPTGQSQRVALYSVQGQLRALATVNQDAEGVMQIDLTGFPRGLYHLDVDLYAQRDLGGTVTGHLDAWVNIAGSTTFTSGVGTAPASVSVSPESASIPVLQSRQFFATGFGSSGPAVFFAPGTIDWDSFGGVATVDNNGLVTANSPGTGSVRATHTPSGLHGAASITVPTPNATPGKWTVLVYLNAANDLSPFAKLNVNQMEQVAGNPDVRFVVQWKQSAELPYQREFDGTRRYLVKPDSTGTIASELVEDMGTNVDMGSEETLLQFINWGKTHYPADRYVLVIWNHGNGWRRGSEEHVITRGVSYDDQFGTSIQTWELAQGLGNNVFDIVAWDASLMQMMEVAYEIKDQARFIAGSEESPPGAGYPYHRVFDQFRDNPDDTTQNLSKQFVEGMLEEYGSTSSKITQSVLDASKLGPLASAVSSLSTQLIAGGAALASAIQNARNTAQSYSPPARVYRDLYDLCLRLEANTSAPPVVAASQAVRAAVDEAVVWEGHNIQSPGSHGVSIDFSSASQFAPIASDYARLRFAADTTWNEFLAQAP